MHTLRNIGIRLKNYLLALFETNFLYQSTEEKSHAVFRLTENLIRKFVCTINIGMKLSKYKYIGIL